MQTSLLSYTRDPLFYSNNSKALPSNLCRNNRQQTLWQHQHHWKIIYFMWIVKKEISQLHRRRLSILPNLMQRWTFCPKSYSHDFLKEPTANRSKSSVWKFQPSDHWCGRPEIHIPNLTIFDFVLRKISILIWPIFRPSKIGTAKRSSHFVHRIECSIKLRTEEEEWSLMHKGFSNLQDCLWKRH